MTELNENTINDILMRSIVNTGFEETITNVVFPILKKGGLHVANRLN